MALIIDSDESIFKSKFELIKIIKFIMLTT